MISSNLLATHTALTQDQNTVVSQYAHGINTLGRHVQNHITRSHEAHTTKPGCPSERLNADRKRLLEFITVAENKLNTIMPRPHGERMLRLMGQLDDLRSGIEALPDYTQYLLAKSEDNLFSEIVKSQEPVHHHGADFATTLNTDSLYPELPVERRLPPEIMSTMSTDDAFVANLLISGEYKPSALRDIGSIDSPTITINATMDEENLLFIASNHEIAQSKPVSEIDLLEAESLSDLSESEYASDLSESEDSSDRLEFWDENNLPPTQNIDNGENPMEWCPENSFHPVPGNAIELLKFSYR